MAFEGMDPDQIRRFAGDFESQAKNVESIMVAIDHEIDRSAASWHGDSSARFASSWRSGSRAQLAGAASDLRGMATLARRNAADQDSASATSGGVTLGSPTSGGVFLGTGTATIHQGGGLFGSIWGGITTVANWQIAQDEEIPGGAWDATKGLGETLWKFSGPRAIIDPQGYVTDTEALGKGLLEAPLHPIRTDEALIDWKDISSGHIGRAAGELLPTAILAALSGGAGAGAKAAEAGSILDRTAEGVSAAQKAGTLYETADDASVAARVQAAGIEPDTAAGEAAKWQAGRPYGGIDPWANAKLQPGKLIAMGKGDYYSGFAIDPADAGSSQSIWERLQVAPRRLLDRDTGKLLSSGPTYRDGIDVFRYTGNDPLDIAKAPTTVENPQFGAGGVAQQYIPDANDLVKSGVLEKVGTIPLDGSPVTIEDPAFRAFNPSLPIDPLTRAGAAAAGFAPGASVGGVVAGGLDVARHEREGR